MFLEVSNAEYIRDYLLKITFNSGEIKLVDLQNSLQGPVFIPLKDKDYFKNFAIHYNTIEWENGADFAPEYLFELGSTIK